jgi:hypothetical protein
LAAEAHRSALKSLEKLRGARHNSQKELAGIYNAIITQHDVDPKVDTLVACDTNRQNDLGGEEDVFIPNGLHMRGAATSKHRPLTLMIDPGFRKPLLVGVGLMLAQQFSGISAVIAFTNSIFAIASNEGSTGTSTAGGDPNTTSSTGDFETTNLEVDVEAGNTKDMIKYFGTISVLTTQVLFSLVAAVVVDK